MLNQALGDDRRHQFVGVVLPLTAPEPEGESERVRQIVAGCGREALGGRSKSAVVCHRARVAAMSEQNKNRLCERYNRPVLQPKTGALRI
jgi:hypothetical protein